MQVYIGIDWSEKQHAIVFQNEAGANLARLTVAHSPAGLQQFEEQRRALGLQVTDCIVGLETAHNLVLDHLWSQAYPQIYVLPPNQVRSSQGRKRQSGARDDPSDAALIAEIVRTDRHRLYPWHPDRPLTRQLRTRVNLYRFLTRELVRHTNRLRAVLLRAYPAAAQVFSSLDTQIAVAFIQAYPTPQAAASLEYAAFEQFCRQQGYPHPKRLPTCFARLQQPQPPATQSTQVAYQGEAPLLAGLVKAVAQARQQVLKELNQLYQQHPDREIFDSLPGAGVYLSAGLLVKLGDDRARFPKPELVQALAGTCPVTQRSGKYQRIAFRRACDHEFRHIAQQWARATVNHSPFATAYYLQVRPHCRSEHHAYRCLANRWLAILWKLWQTHQPYDEAYHMRQRIARSKPRA